MLYALTQPERELLSNLYIRYSNHASYARSDNECFNYPIAPHVVYKSVEFRGVDSFTHYIRSL